MRKSRFLVVDSSKIILNTLSNIITNRIGASEVLLAHDGLEALKLLKNNKVDIIISDWHMPSLDGLELLGEIRNNSELCNIPFIMMSSHGSKEDVLTAIQHGVSQYVVKPFSPEKIDDAVRKAYNSAKKRVARRYSGLPKHQVKASFADQVLPAQLVNISRSGALLKMDYTDNIQLFANISMVIDFEDLSQLPVINLGPVSGWVVRMEAAVDYQAAIHKCEVALNFSPESNSKEVNEQITSVLQALQEKEAMAS